MAATEQLYAAWQEQQLHKDAAQLHELEREKAETELRRQAAQTAFEREQALKAVIEQKRQELALVQVRERSDHEARTLRRKRSAQQARDAERHAVTAAWAPSASHSAHSYLRQADISSNSKSAQALDDDELGSSRHKQQHDVAADRTRSTARVASPPASALNDSLGDALAQQRQQQQQQQHRKDAAPTVASSAQATTRYSAASLSDSNRPAVRDTVSHSEFSSSSLHRATAATNSVLAVHVTAEPLSRRSSARSVKALSPPRDTAVHTTAATAAVAHKYHDEVCVTLPVFSKLHIPHAYDAFGLTMTDCSAVYLGVYNTTGRV